MDFDLRVGTFVQAVDIPNWVFRQEVGGLVGVVIKPAESPLGPLVRWQNGWTCNVYSRWVKELDGSISRSELVDMVEEG